MIRNFSMKACAQVLAGLWILHVLLASRGMAAETSFGQRVFLHLVCDGGVDPAMVFEWKGGSINSFAAESGSVQRTSSSGLVHVSNPARPAVDSFLDAYGSRVAILNGLSAPAMDAHAVAGPALEVELGGKARLWLAAYVEDAGKGRPAPVLAFPGIRIEGSMDDFSLVGRVPAALLSLTPPAAPFPASVQERLFTDARVDFSTWTSALRPRSGDWSKSRALDKQHRMLQVFRSSIPAAWAASHDAAQPDFVNYSKVALRMFASGKSLAAFVRVGGADAWSAPSNHFTRQSAMIQSLFSGIDAILNDAYAQGLQSRLVIVVSGQYGRSPWLNASGGKDPWPVSSMMFWGNGIRGRITGGMDANGRGIKIDPRFGTTTGEVISLTFQNAFASMLFLAGVDYRKWTSAVPVSGVLEVGS